MKSPAGLMPRLLNRRTYACVSDLPSALAFSAISRVLQTSIAAAPSVWLAQFGSIKDFFPERTAFQELITDWSRCRHTCTFIMKFTRSGKISTCSLNISSIQFDDVLMGRVG